MASMNPGKTGGTKPAGGQQPQSKPTTQPNKPETPGKQQPGQQPGKAKK